jgi:hypothetical protein
MEMVLVFLLVQRRLLIMLAIAAVAIAAVAIATAIAETIEKTEEIQLEVIRSVELLEIEGVERVISVNKKFIFGG